jgi:hypothetical protein
MKKLSTTDAKRAAANDKPEDGNGKIERVKVTTSLRTVPANGFANEGLISLFSLGSLSNGLLCRVVAH